MRALAVAAVLGGAVGATLLLLTPSATFERIAPWLIGRRLAGDHAPPAHPAGARAGEEPHVAGTGLVGGVFLVGIYGGYFGAAAGVLLLALLLAGTTDTLARSNALKNVVLGIANATAALGFACWRPCAGRRSCRSPSDCSPARGSGPSSCATRTPRVLRALIGVAGLALAVKLGIDAYG